MDDGEGATRTAGPARDGRPPAGRPEKEAFPAGGPRQFPGEVDGPRGPEPTRFGDWEKGGRCTDF